MAYQTFENIMAWQKARELATYIYKIFRLSQDYSFRDQIQRAVVSVMNNVAEGRERDGKRELRKFLYIAKGSSGEARSMLTLAKDLEKISESEFSIGYNLSLETSRIIGDFIKTLQPS
jgi:four helix bundle protein